ncbi:hypothetical protein J3Q64DRAFT_1710250 [Phycomyces blakesleeanus]|uniref:Uncharacterized protein n=1 Tax=Phycomyces blakesleeanus TaxID=4837 RepID=A0ABR3BDY8_PHYBL
MLIIIYNMTLYLYDSFFCFYHSFLYCIAAGSLNYIEILYVHSIILKLIHDFIFFLIFIHVLI